MLTHDQIQQHINERDAHIPKEDAELAIWYEGAPMMKVSKVLVWVEAA
jgi:hypothetical protein